MFILQCWLLVNFYPVPMAPDKKREGNGRKKMCSDKFSNVKNLLLWGFVLFAQHTMHGTSVLQTSLHQRFVVATSLTELHVMRFPISVRIFGANVVNQKKTIRNTPETWIYFYFQTRFVRTADTSGNGTTPSFSLIYFCNLQLQISINTFCNSLKVHCSQFH